MHQLLVRAELVFAAALLLAAAAHDIAVRTIPNRMSALLALDGFAIRLEQAQPAFGILAALAVFSVCFLLWKRNLMGGGDVKLLGAAALLVPPLAVPRLMLAVAVAGGLFALAYCAMRPLLARPRAVRPDRLLGRILRVERRRIRRGQSMPYASAIAAGTLFALFPG